MTVTKLASKDARQLLPMLMKLNPGAIGTIKQDFEVGLLHSSSFLATLNSLKTLPGVTSLTWDCRGFLSKSFVVYFQGTAETGLQIFSRLMRMCDDEY